MGIYISKITRGSSLMLMSVPLRLISADLVEIALNRQCFALDEAMFCPFQGNKLPLKGNFQEVACLKSQV